MFAGRAAGMFDADRGAPGTLGVALAFGLVITATISAVGRVSGAQLGPA